MDDFVNNKLTEWDLGEWIETFKEQRIDKNNIYGLDERDIVDLIPIVGPRSTFKMNLKLLKEKNTNQKTVDSSAQEHKEAPDSAQVWPSTSDTSDKGKRKLDQGESSKWPSPPGKRQRDTIRGSCLEEDMLCVVKEILRCVQMRLCNQENNKLNKSLKDKISVLETEKRELVGVFGKTGAGKSYLINAIIGEKNLLPSGEFRACTTVVIKVEANMQSSKYEAEIEFITKEQWKQELEFFLGEKAHQDNDDYRDFIEKVSAVYGEEWKDKSPENLMDDKYFEKISEFLISKKKILTFESAEELSENLVNFTRSDSKDREGEEVKRWYWPLVKCVTVKVPGKDILRNVTLVDLPGNGDRNKSRDKMWTEVVGSCSTVWIVADISRAASETEAWNILKDTSSKMGNGGQCQEIHFICTKSDLIEDSDSPSAAGDRALKFKKVKEEVRKQFNNQSKVKNHFSDDCFKVFTVSSKEFLKQNHPNPDDNEIPKLKEFLQNLNDSYSETLKYVSGAHGILCLIQGAKSIEVADKQTKVRTNLEENMRHELDKVREAMDEAHKAFEKCLSVGVEKSKISCDQILHSVLNPEDVSGSAFHRSLKCVAQKGGIHKPRDMEQIDINADLASCLTDSIDEEFKKIFPNEGTCGPFNGVINKISLDTKTLTQKHKEFKLQLIFLSTEEENIKTKLNKIILNGKKEIYRSLTTTIQTTMQECYTKAAAFTGKGTLNNMKDTMMDHLNVSKNTMFEQAKNVMLDSLRVLEEDILQTLEETMQESIDLSLKTDAVSIPVSLDVTEELALVKKYYNELRGSPDGQTLNADPPGPAAAP